MSRSTMMRFSGGQKFEIPRDLSCMDEPKLMRGSTTRSQSYIFGGWPRYRYLVFTQQTTEMMSISTLLTTLVYTSHTSSDSSCPYCWGAWPLTSGLGHELLIAVWPTVNWADNKHQIWVGRRNNECSRWRNLNLWYVPALLREWKPPYTQPSAFQTTILEQWALSDDASATAITQGYSCPHIAINLF